MTNPYPANFEGLDGSRRLTGQVDFTDAGNQPGAAQPITREELAGNVVTIADGASDRLTWNSSGGPDVLLDRTDPAIPLIIDAGVYAFQVTVLAGTGMSTGAWIGAQLKLDGAGFNASAYIDSRQPSAVIGTGPLGNGSAAPATSLNLTWYMPAAARVEVWVANIDGTHSNDILISVAHVQRLS